MAAVEAEIDRFFQVVDGELPEDFRFSDADIRRLASLLSTLPQAKPPWSRVPRAYIVLRIIGKEALLDEFLRPGFSDYLFPVNSNGLPNCLDAPGRVDFVKAQRLVCTKAVDLEKGGHQVFAADQSEDLFTVNRVLGTSTSSQVDYVTSNLSFEEYARKRIVRRTAGQRRFSETASIFTGELKILKRLKHEHIVAIRGSYTDPKYFVLLLSPVADCNLTEFFGRVLESPDLKVTLRTFFGCLATAVAYLHDNLIKHKDIKPQNMLICRGTVLLTDFGISRLAEDASGVTTDGWTLKTPRYCAPEVAAYDKRNNSSDVWSLGCVFLEIVTTLKCLPVADMITFFQTNGSRETNMSANEEAVRKWIHHLNGVAPADDNSALIWTTTMLQYSRDSRPTARQVVRIVYENYGNSSRYMYGGLCCHNDFDDNSIPDISPSPSIEHIVGPNDTPERAVKPIEARPYPDEAFVSNTGILAPGNTENLPHTAGTRSNLLTIVQSNTYRPDLEPPRRSFGDQMPFEQLHVNNTYTMLQDRLIMSLHSAANAATMRIYKSAMRQHGRQFANTVLDYVHDGGNFRKDALIQAISKDEYTVMEFLLQAGMDANAMVWQIAHPCPPLGRAMSEYVNRNNTTSTCTILLLDHAARLERIPRELKSQCLERACERKDFMFVEKLFAAGFSIRDLEDSHKFLSAACTNCNPPADIVIEMLLQHGVRHWPRGREEDSAMHLTLSSVFSGRKIFKYIQTHQARANVLIILLRAGILPRTQEDRNQTIRAAILFNRLDIIEILNQSGHSMTPDESSFGMQLWHFQYSEPWPESSLFWHKTFWKQGLHPFRKMELLPEVDDGQLASDHPLITPINLYLIGMVEAEGKTYYSGWKQLVEEQFANVYGSCKKFDIQCWLIVDQLLMINYNAVDQASSAEEQTQYESYLSTIIKLSKNLKVPTAVRKSTNYAFFCESELVAAIYLGSALTVRMLLDAGEDINGAIFDKAKGRYRSPLNFALNMLDPVDVEPSWAMNVMFRDDDHDGDWHEARQNGIVELLKERGARDFTKEPSAFDRLSRTLRLKKI